MFSQQGHFTLGHSESSMNTLMTRAEINKSVGVESTILSPPEIKRRVPEIDISDHPRYPIMGALYHPPGGIIRHDAVVWAYARGADRLGVDIHNQTLIPVSEIPAHVPGRPHLATCWRWIQRGCRGVKLESVLIGGKRFSSLEALQTFVEATTAAADGTSTVIASTPSARKKAQDRANRELDDEGI